MALAIVAAQQVYGQLKPQVHDRRRRARRCRNKGRFLRRAVRDRNESTGSAWWQPSRATFKIKPSRSAVKATAIRDELVDFEPAQRAAIVAYEEAAQQYERERELDDLYEFAIPDGLRTQGRAVRLVGCPTYFEDQATILEEDPEIASPIIARYIEVFDDQDDTLVDDVELGRAAFMIEQLERSVFEHITT